jgi:hypothetical protein
VWPVLRPAQRNLFSWVRETPLSEMHRKYKKSLFSLSIELACVLQAFQPSNHQLVDVPPAAAP